MALSLIYSSLQLFYFLFLWLLRINFCRQHPEMCFCIWNCRQQSQHNGANEYTTLPIPSHLLRMRSAEREQIRIQIELAIIMVSSCISALGRWTHMARRLVDRHCCVFVVFFFVFLYVCAVAHAQWRARKLSKLSTRAAWMPLSQQQRL